MPGDTSPFFEVATSQWLTSNRSAFAIDDRFPVSPGHSLVIPRRLIATWWEATRDERLDLWDLVDEVKALLDASHAPNGYNVGFNAGRAAGQTVAHLHVHVIPRYDGDSDDPTGGIRHVFPARANYLAPQVQLRGVGTPVVAGASSGRTPLRPPENSSTPRRLPGSPPVDTVVRPGAVQRGTGQHGDDEPVDVVQHRLGDDLTQWTRIACVCSAQCSEVAVSLPFEDGHQWVPEPHKNQFEHQSARPPVAIDKRVYLRETVANPSEGLGREVDVGVWLATSWPGGVFTEVSRGFRIGGVLMRCHFLDGGHRHAVHTTCGIAVPLHLQILFERLGTYRSTIV